MPIRACWKSVVAFCQKCRPTKRRRRKFGFFAESFEPRRLLSAFFVNSFGDSHDANPGDGIAADTNGLTTLRAAIEETNALDGADSITLPAGIINVVGEAFTVTGPLTVQGASHGSSTIDGSSLDQVFNLTASGRLSLSNVRVNSASEVAAAIRSNLITTNPRQADLVIAFVGSPNVPVSVDTKSPDVSTPWTDLAFDTLLDRLSDQPAVRVTKAVRPLEKPVRPDGDLIPAPDASIDDIVNALFQREASDLVLPIGAEQPFGTKKPTAPMAEDRSSKPAPMPMSDSDRPAAPPANDPPGNSESSSLFNGMMSDMDAIPDVDGEYSFASPVSNDAVQAVLSGWADEAGWQAPEFWTNDSCNQFATRPESGNKLAAMAVVALGSITAQAWSTGPRWLRESVNVSSWQRRLAKLRRRAR